MRKRYRDLKSLSEQDCAETIRSRYMDGEINLHGYKTAIILQVTNRGCCHASTSIATAWLRGKDFDRVIAALRRAKKAWFKAPGV